MPRLETSPMEQRQRFITAWRARLCSVSELCQQFGISRKTGHKWLSRFTAGGLPALADRSRAPHHCPHRIDAALTELLCDARRRHPDWGPAKLIPWLARRHPRLTWPAPSTVGEILARHGLVVAGRRRRQQPHPGHQLVAAQAPNDVWNADFKGQFYTGDRRICYPLTVTDLHSRFLMTCRGFPSPATAPTQAAFEQAFRTYGLPRAIRTDNGAPFTSHGLHGLSRLNVWWLRLGIAHVRTRPAKPQDNGAHERFHRTLKAGAIRPPRASLPAQQRAFDAFRTIYNRERPHAALDDRTPADLYHASPRPFPARLAPLAYPGHYQVRRVTHNGTIRFQGQLLFLATPLAHLDVGLVETADGVWTVYCAHLALARFHERDYIIRA